LWPHDRVKLSRGQVPPVQSASFIREILKSVVKFFKDISAFPVHHSCRDGGLVAP
jgi:hypothetical protein